MNTSSIGAQVNPAGSGYYSATKAALESMSGSLRKELEPLGISVTVIAPGVLRTDFAGRSLTQSAEAIADYAGTAGTRRKENDTADPARAGDPRKAAEAIIAAVDSSAPPGYLLLGNDAIEAYSRASDAERREVAEWESGSRML